MNLRDLAFEFMTGVISFLLGMSVYDYLFHLEIVAPDIVGQVLEVFEFIIVVMFIQTVVNHYIKNHLIKNRTNSQFILLVMASIILAFLKVIALPRIF